MNETITNQIVETAKYELMKLNSVEFLIFMAISMMAYYFFGKQGSLRLSNKEKQNCSKTRDDIYKKLDSIQDIAIHNKEHIIAINKDIEYLKNRKD